MGKSDEVTTFQSASFLKWRIIRFKKHPCFKMETNSNSAAL